VTFEGPRRARALGRPWPRPSARTLLAALVLAPWLAWAVVRTFGWETGSRGAAAITFTPYVAFASPVPLLLAVLLRRWAVAAVGAVVVVAFALAVLPRAIGGPNPAVHDGIALRVMTANVYVGAADPRSIVALVQRYRIDVLALEELTPEEVGRLDAAGLRRVLPYRDVDARPDADGSGLFSRRPLRSLPQVNALGVNGEPRAALAIPGAPPLEIGAIHPPPPNYADPTIWPAMLREIPRPDRTSPTLRLALGDFNATLDHAELRDLLGGDHGYVDAADATGQGLHPTWPTNRRFPPLITIDHVLLDPRIAARATSVHDVAGSDHRALIATLELPRAVTPALRAPAPPATR
jgi:endonuclease/exonuclease/phosphatase (EEP) superfamily protein YafD